MALGLSNLPAGTSVDPVWPAFLSQSPLKRLAGAAPSRVGVVKAGFDSQDCDRWLSLTGPGQKLLRDGGQRTRSAVYRSGRGSGGESPHFQIEVMMFEVSVEFAGRRWVAGSRSDWDDACALCAQWFRSLYHPDARWVVRGGGREAAAVLSVHGSVWVLEA